MKNKLIFIILFFAPFLSFSQEKQESVSQFDKVLQLDKAPLQSQLKLPLINIGTGVVSYHGDIVNDEPINFSVGCNAVHFEMLQSMIPTLYLGIRYLRSDLRGSAYYPENQTYFNFKTEVNSFGAFVKYDFSNINAISSRSKILSPYVSVGVSILQRPEARGDWYSNGQKMYLWSDGTFRTSAENEYNSDAKIIYRDFDYETALQIENQDKKDYYTPIIASIPLELGLTYKIGKGANINLGYQYHISATNTLDDITGKGEGKRKGSKLSDGYSYAYVALTIDIENLPHKSKFDDVANEDYRVYWDADEDGIDETEDDCPYTPKGVDVFANGCPLDDDNDGIPNYMDKERMTRAFWHDEKGVGMTEAELRDRIIGGEKLNQNELYVYYPELLNGSTLTKQFYKRIPKKFKPCDTDNNDYIDLTELLNTINTFFDEGPEAGPGASFTSKDLSKLIEFFFLQ